MTNNEILEAQICSGIASYGVQFFLIASEILKPESFTCEPTREFFEAAKVAYTTSGSTHLTNVCTILAGDDGDLMAVYYEYANAFEQLDKQMTEADFTASCKRLNEIHANRLLVGVSQNIAGSSNAQKTIDDISSKLLNISDMLNTSSTVVSANDAVDMALESIAKAQERDGKVGIPSGIDELDVKLAGFKAGELIIVAARPAMGKTAFELTIAEHTAVKNNIPTLIFSLEMGAGQLMSRVLGMNGGIDMDHLRTGKLDSREGQKLKDAAETIRNSPLTIDEAPSITIPQIQARAARWRKANPSDDAVIMIDYLTLIKDSGKKGATKAELVGDMSRALKQVARELKVPVILLSQLNRDVEKRQDKRPMMSDLRDSGAIEQDADVIIFLYRDEVYNKASPDKGTAEIIIGKQRGGSIGTVRTTYIDNQTRFVNLSQNAYSAPIRVYGE